MSLKESSQELLKAIEKEELDNGPEAARLRTCANRLLTAARTVEDSASGSNFGFHGELYYGDFQRPPHRFNIEWGGINGLPPGWKTRTPEEVKQRIEELAKLSFDDAEQQSVRILESAKHLANEIIIAMSPLHRISVFAKEKEILMQLENFDWAENVKNKFCADTMRSFPNMTRDSYAVSQGSMLPAHTFYEGQAIQIDKSCEAVQRFWKLSSRLLRQVQIQMDSSSSGGKQETDAAANLAVICKRFHAVAVQLSKRREKRPTLVIKDEYDVQDLLNAFLRLYFDDVRPEEPTPSIGGGAARMDFLLKIEKIVVEAKMTRPDLQDRTIFDELVQDAARYKAHPDCKKLVCLIYDREGYLKNPHGLAGDIRGLSSSSLTVEVHIVPQR